MNIFQCNTYKMSCSNCYNHESSSPKYLFSQKLIHIFADFSKVLNQKINYIGDKVF